jgi:hypothetical protein
VVATLLRHMVHCKQRDGAREDGGGRRLEGPEAREEAGREDRQDGQGGRQGGPVGGAGLGRGTGLARRPAIA